MSTTTKEPTEEVAGRDEENETTLFGMDEAALTPINPEEEEVEAGTESLTDGVRPVACEGCREEDRRYPPCVSRVIDANGNALVTIILGAPERSLYLGTIIGLIDSASENDVIDITLVACVSGEAGTMSQRSLLSAIDRCRGTVITRAGALTTVGDVAIWLSGDQLRMSKMGAVFMRQPINGFGGDLADYESKLANFRESFQEFSSFIVERGLFSQEEMDRMYQERSMLSLYGDKLVQRVANLKSVE